MSDESENPKVQPSEIVISLGDLSTDEIQQSVERLQESAKPQLIRTVGDESSRPIWRNPILSNSLIGLLGAFASAVLAEILCQGDSTHPWFGDSALINTLMYFGSFALFLGVAFNFAESIETRSAAKVWRSIGLGSALMMGPILILGSLANGIYVHLWANYQYAIYLQQGVNAADNAYYSIHHHIIRGIAWGLVAMGTGIGLGLAKKSIRAVVNGLSAGIIGGFIGGFVFDYINISTTSGVANRLIADGIIGLLVGISLGLISEISKQHWIEIVSGGMAGKQFIVFSSSTKVGSSPSADITLIKDATISPSQFELRASGKTLSLRTFDGIYNTTVNGVQPTPNQVLRDGDLIGVGATVLRYRSKTEEMPSLK
jgi:hypothetical protein